MRNKVLLLFAILLLLVGAVLVYLNVDKLNLRKEVELRSLLPSNAVSIFESPTIISAWNDFMKTSMWENLKTIESYNSINEFLISLDNLTGNVGLLDQISGKEKFLISTHVISNTKYDHIFYLDLRNPQYQQYFFNKLNEGIVNKDYIQKQRNYNGLSIYELAQDKTSNPFLSYILIDNILVTSRTPYLVEDVIRTYQGEYESFFEENENLSSVTKLEYDAGNLYFNLRELNRYLRLFFNNSKEQFLFPINDIKGNAFADVDFNEKYTFINGLLYPENENLFLDIFQRQRSTTLEFLDLIPDKASYFFYYNFNDGSTFYEDLWNYYRVAEPNLFSDHSKFFEDSEFASDRFKSWINASIVRFDYESYGADEGKKLVLIKSNDINEATNQFSTYAEALGMKSEDSLYRETYYDKVITQIETEDLPLKLFGRGFEGFSSTFFTSIDQYIVIANEIDGLKQLIDDIENERVWSKSLSKSEFIDLALEDSNVGVIVDMPRVWNSIQQVLSPEWGTNLSAKRENFLHFELWGAQFNVLNDNYYSNLLIKHKSFEGLSTRGNQKQEIDFEVQLNAPVVRKPQLVRNHNNGAREILIQDSLSNFSLLSSQGQVIWSDSLEQEITSEIFQIDYFKNRKLQYAFLVGNKLCLIDRNGVPVEGFPKLIEDFQPEGFKVVDYDNSRNYRFVFYELNGNVWLTDKNLKTLEGWNPNYFNSSLSRVPFHARVRGRDVFIILDRNGRLTLTNRRGETLSGFPIDLGARISGDIFLESRSSFNDSRMHVVTEGGELIKIAFNAEIKERKQLYRPSKESMFGLVNERQEKTYLISRQDYNTLAVLDKEGDLLFEKDYFVSDPFEVQYYNYGTSKEIFAVRSPAEGKVYLYDENGKLLVYPAINCDYPVSIMYFENESMFKVYGAADRNIYAVKIR